MSSKLKARFFSAVAAVLVDHNDDANTCMNTRYDEFGHMSLETGRQTCDRKEGA